MESLDARTILISPHDEKVMMIHFLPPITCIINSEYNSSFASQAAAKRCETFLCAMFTTYVFLHLPS